MRKNRTIRKITALVLIAVLGMFGLAGCGSSDSGKATTAESAVTDAVEGSEASTEASVDISGVKLLNDGTLTVGCELGYPPFEDFAEDGTTPVGFDIDIITEVARRLGLELNIINTAWDGIFTGIDVNYDCVCSSVTITPERQKTMIFTDPYINNYQAVVLPTGSDKKITGFKELAGMSIAVQKETTSDILMSDYKSTGTVDMEIVANEKVTTGFTQLTNNEVDAVVVDSTVADSYVAKEPDVYQIAYLDKDEPEQFAIAMGKGSTALQAAMNEALKGMEEDGFIQDTYDYWFGSAE